MGGNHVLNPDKSLKHCRICKSIMEWVATEHGNDYCTDNYRCYNIHCVLYHTIQKFKRK